MAYHQLEDLTSRKREKVALFLTAENMAGLLAVALPCYLGTAHVELWLRIPILITAAALGVALTSEVQGLALYERVLWFQTKSLDHSVSSIVDQFRKRHL